MLRDSYTKQIMRIRDRQQTDVKIIQALIVLKNDAVFDVSITSKERQSIIKRINYNLNLLGGTDNAKS